MYQKKSIHSQIEKSGLVPLSQVDPLSFSASLPSKEAVAQLAQSFEVAQGTAVFLSYAGVGGVRFAGCLIAASSIDRPIAFCPVSTDLVVASAMWRLEVMRQLSLAREIAANPANDVVPAIWLNGLKSGLRDVPPWIFALACVPIDDQWDGGLRYPVPFCPGRFERMARQPQARVWLETHSSTPSTNRRTQIRLTKREKQVLRAICRGLAEGQIAGALKISVHTVHVYVKHLYRKFGVESRSDLMAVFIDQAAVDAAIGE